MDCKEFREKLDLYVDRELSAEASSAAQLHLQECSRCRHAEEALLQLRQGVREVVMSHKPPAQLIANVSAITQVRGRELFGSYHGRLPLWRYRIAFPVPVLALLLVIAVGVVVVFMLQRARQPDSSATANQARTSPQDDTRSMDLSRFDHGGRVSLVKVKR